MSTPGFADVADIRLNFSIVKENDINDELDRLATAIATKYHREVRIVIRGRLR